MRHFLLNNSLVLTLKYVFVLITFAALTACGGGGGAANPFVSTSGVPAVRVPTTAAVASRVQLLSSSTQLSSATGSMVTLTAIAVDANGQTIANRPVFFSVPPTETAIINGIAPAAATGGGGITDVNGSVTATLNLGTNKTNRPITVTATVDGLVATAIVNVAGTTLAVAGNTSVALNAATNLTFTVKDAAGVPIPNQLVTITSLAGNTITPVLVTGFPSSTTDALGVVTATVTATRGGPDTITATAAGAMTTSVLTVSADSFAFTNPTLVPIEIPLSPASGVVSVAWSNINGGVAGSSVAFTSTRGTFVGVNPSTTNASGVASISVQSTTAGPAIITATGAGGMPSATLPVTFVATTANSIVAQANPATVQATVAGVVGQAGNTSVISVTVRDIANNLVKNATVNFSLTDNTGGSINSPTAVTDVNGNASVTYTAGATTSAQNGVVITATVTSVGGIALAAIQSNPVTLTVSGRTLFVRLGTDNKIVQDTVNKTNTITYAAIVTDSAGNPVLNQRVSFALRPAATPYSAYFKGWYVWNAAVAPLTPMWVKQVNVPCQNEDINFNGTLDLGEDFNLNLIVDPGNIAAVVSFATTNLNGIALAPVTYLQNYATWAQVTLEATAGVVGTDPPTRATFMLPGVSTDYTTQTVAPPGATSPFGTALVCNNPN